MLSSNTSNSYTRCLNGKNLVNNGVAQEVVLTGGDIKVGGNSAVKDATVESVVANHEGRVKANEDAIAIIDVIYKGKSEATHGNKIS